MDVGLDRVPAGSRTARLTSFLQARLLFIEAGGLGVAILILLVSTLPNLANHPTLTDDEMWVLSAAFKLAREGVFGSDMFAGFFNADRHYYFNMPLHHVAIAASLKLFGAGIVQARLVGVAYAVATLVLTYLLARRLYGVPAGMLALALLLFLRLNIGFDTGLPLQELAVNLRYDLAPVPFILGAVLLLLSPRLMALRVAVVGLLLGIAVVMQFYGAFLFPIAVAFIWLERLTVQQRLKLTGALLGAAALVGLPYGAYILSSYDDFKGQAGTIDHRADFTSPSFYLENLSNEPSRFLRPLAFKEVPRGADHALVGPQWLSVKETLTRRPSSKIAVLIGVPAVLVYAGWRGLRVGSRGDRLLFLVLGGLIVQYALFESTKFYFYWIPVVPFLCIGIAGVAVRLLQNVRRDVLSAVLAGATLAALLIFAAEGSVARVGGIRAAPEATDYDRLSETIHHYVPPGSRVVGSTSLWWGMRDMDYRSYFLFFYLTRADAGPYKTTISGFLDDYKPQYIVLTRLAIGELETHLIPRDFNDWSSYLSQHGELVARIQGPVVIKAYGFIDIWKIRLTPGQSWLKAPA